MILREATTDDLWPLMALCKKAWTHLGIPFDTDLPRFKKWAAKVRTVVLYDDTGLTAALAARHAETDRGPGFEVVLFVVDPDASDKIKLLDAVSLYACNLALADQRPIIISRWRKTTPGVRYGRDLVSMDARDDGADRVQQIGHAQTIAQRILARRPEWA